MKKGTPYVTIVCDTSAAARGWAQYSYKIAEWNILKVQREGLARNGRGQYRVYYKKDDRDI